jgi:polysaccharide chain length determinant protein (PEP-CTERM system associated)
MHELADQLLTHLKAIWRYKWYALVIAWAVSLAGWIAVYQMPDRYSVSARVFLDDESQLTPLLKGITLMPDLANVARLVSKDFLTSQNFTEVIRRVEPKVGFKTDQERNELMGKLYGNASIGLAKRRGVYWITFVDEDPQLAEHVVQSLLDLFVERSLGENREDSTSARRFIDEQLDDYRRTLESAENEMIEFKRRNMALLPGAGTNYFAKLEQAKDAVRKAELELSEAEKTTDSIKKQLAIASRKASLSDDKNLAQPGTPVSPIEVRIGSLEKKLDELRFRYTEEHPDIAALVDMLAKLNERKAEEDAEAKLAMEQKNAEAMLNGDISSSLQTTDPVYQQLTVSLTAAEAKEAAIRARAAEYGRRYVELRAAANAAPQVEAEFTQLTRDYQVTKDHYADLLRRRDKARMSEAMETGSSTVGFRVILRPRAPGAPSEPDRLRLMTLVLLVGLGAGLGTAWAISQMRPTIGDERTLKKVSGLPVLGTVVFSWTDAQRKRWKWGLIAFVSSIGSLLTAYGAIMATLLLKA